MKTKNVRVMINKQIDGDKTDVEMANAPDAWFTEIKVVDALERSEDDNILENLCSKVKLGGKIILSGIDAHEICRRVHYGKLGLAAAAEHLFKNANRLNSIADLKDYLVNQKKWKILFAGLQDGRYLVEAERNQ